MKNIFLIVTAQFVGSGILQNQSQIGDALSVAMVAKDQNNFSFTTRILRYHRTIEIHDML